MWNTKGRVLTILAATLLVGALALPAAGQDLDEAEDESWMTLSGTVTSVSDHEFKLDYGSGIVRIEMDDWSDDPDARHVSQGDRVTVTGKFDDEFFETTSIEAASVYVEDLNTYFYANPADEEGDPGSTFSQRMISSPNPVEISAATVIGTVTGVEGRHFTIDVGVTELTIDTSELNYNPTDDEGYQQVDTGDRVRVSGKMHADFFDGRRLHADSVTTLWTMTS